MIELFEFNVTRPIDLAFSDEDGNRFITDFLEPRGLSWGGGGNSNCVHGVISAEQSIELELVLNEFTSFFEDSDRIVLRLIAPANTLCLSQCVSRQNVTFESYEGD